MDFLLEFLLENQGIAVDAVYLDFSEVLDGVYDIFLDKRKDELTFKSLCVQGTW